MLLVIHNLPSNTRYGDVKSLIQLQCSINNVILDNLVNEGICKKVTVGVADAADAIAIERKLNGLQLGGNHLYVEDMRNNKDNAFDTHKGGSKWSSPQNSNNLPSLLGHMGNTMNTRQGSSMLGQNNSAMNQMGMNAPMMRQNNSIGSIAPLMGQIAPFIGSPSGSMGPNAPMMVPPPLMGHSAPTPYSGPFYMSPQTNDYGNYGNGQPMADQYSSLKDTAPSQNYGYPNTGNRNTGPDKTISVWATPDEPNSFSGRGFSGNHRERHQSRQSSSRRTKWDGPQEVYESVGTRDTSKRVRPWADDSRAEYGSFDRSYDRGQDRYSRRQDSRQVDDSGSNMYQRRPPDGSHSRSNYRRNTSPEMRRGPPRDEYRGRDVRSPPPKRFRPDNFYNAPAVKPGPVYPKEKKTPKKLTMTKIIERDGVWRSQTAAKLVKEMFTKIKMDHTVPHNIAFHKMKAAVRNRLIILLNNKLEVKIPDQEMLYRRKFKPDEDQYLYNRVIRHIHHEQKRKPAESDAQEADVDPDAPKVSQPAAVQPAPATATAPAPVEQAPDKLPKYPQGNKAAYQLQKKQFKKELTEQNEPELDPVMKKAVDLEIDSIKDIILAECIEPHHEGETMFCKRMHEPEIMEEIRKMITLNLAKRILNLGTVPLVRILGLPKPPRKAPLEEFLKTRGVISLKKSDRKPMYIATCNSYDSFDNLCALKDIFIDNIKVLFKPMYLTAPPEKVNHKKKVQRAWKQAHETSNQEESDTQIEEKSEEMASDDPKTEVNEIKQDIGKSNASTAGIKTEVVTPIKTNPTGAVPQSVSTDIKQEVVTPAKSKPVEAESKGNVQTGDDNLQETDDEPYNEGDWAEYPIEENSEVNEDDLEDY